MKLNGRHFKMSDRVEVLWPHLLVELGVEKRSMAGAELMVPPTMETGEESVVTAPGSFWSSFRRCSYINQEASVSILL